MGPVVYCVVQGFPQPGWSYVELDALLYFWIVVDEVLPSLAFPMYLVAAKNEDQEGRRAIDIIRSCLSCHCRVIL